MAENFEDIIKKAYDAEAEEILRDVAKREAEDPEFAALKADEGMKRELLHLREEKTAGATTGEIHGDIISRDEDGDTEEEFLLEQMSAEAREAYRLGQEMQKRRMERSDNEEGNVGKRKGKVRFLTKKAYLVAAMAAVLMLAFGMTAAGGEHYVMNMMHSILQGKTQTVMNSEEEAREYSEKAKDGVCTKVNDELGISMVELFYLPSAYNFASLEVDSTADRAYILYNGENDGWIRYYIYANQSDQSIAVYYDDELLGEEQVVVSDTTITISEYRDADSEIYCEAIFTYDNVNYQLSSNVDNAEFQKIVENLFFY